MLVRLLGPVDVLGDDGPQQIRGVRRKALLAALALNGGEMISAGRLAELVWAEDAPPTAANTLQSHVSYLRTLLGARSAISARGPGYLLDLGGESSDVQVAERLLQQGRQAADPRQGAGHLRAALDLWRGEPLADLTCLSWVEQEADRLDLLHSQVRRALTEARLAAGEHAELVPALEEMVAHSPLDEQVHGQLMLALYRCGRQADALAAYGRLRDVLAGQLGIDPSPVLRDLHTAILRQDETLAVPAQPLTSLAAPPAPVPAQLPPAVPGFAGRAAELASLDAALARAEQKGPAGSPAVVISAVSGTAGVGKTALAIQWAHQVAPRFPDGQLHVNLNGFAPRGQPTRPAEAVRGFLAALGVAPADIPDGVPAQTALYRSLLAGRRMLVVLDNARDAAQVRPLLPGSPGCLVIVTSRSDLAGLVAAQAAIPVSLDVLSPAEATELLAARLGEERVAREPAAVREIIDRCARLPLALAIAAARAAARPAFPLAAIAAGLRGATTASLDSFASTDPATDVRAVLSWSCRLLSDDAARLFTLLGLHPGPDISIPAAASLAAIPPGRAQALLAELAAAHLLAEHAPGRYTAHDLLRTYATEQANSLLPDDARTAARDRVLGHYLHTAYRAARLMKPERDQIGLPEPPPGTMAEELTDPDSALAWFTAEHRVLLACISTSATAGLDRHIWQLGWTMRTYLFRGGHWHELLATQTAAVEAARRNGDLPGLAPSLVNLAETEVRLNHLGKAEARYREALALYTAAGDLTRAADVWIGLSALAGEQNRFADALRFSRQALGTSRRAGDRSGQALALNSIAWDHSTLGEYDRAVASCREALALMRELGLREGEACTWDTMGSALHGLADYQQAAECYLRAVGLFRELGDLYHEAGALTSLGEVHLSAGDHGAARRAWAGAVRILEEIGHADASRVRAKLTALPGSGARSAMVMAD